MADASRQLAEEEYPDALRHIPGPPQTLYARGSFPAKGTKLLAVVGSRAQTAYGRAACESLIAGLSGYPISIVSGLAVGTDACAHRAALSASLHAIAVPGSGLGDDVLYPRANAGIARDILAAGGLLLSEHPDDYRPRAHDFPSRNRIMAGLSDAVLVIEAGEKSGTLITARLAGEYNRELLMVPHRIKDPHSFGAHLFLRLGATLVSEPAHIFEALGIAQKPPHERADTLSLSDDERRIYDLLSEPLPRDELIRNAGMDAGDTLTILVTLELKNLVKEEFGAWRRV